MVIRRKSMELKLVLLIIIFSIVMMILLIFKWKEIAEIEEEKEKSASPLESLEEESTFKQFLKRFSKQENSLLIPIGMKEENLKIINMGDVHNLLIIGTTGGGKSICLNEMITSIALSYSKEEVRILTIDTSIVELSSFNEIPHYIKNTISTPKDIIEELKELQKESERRIKAGNKQNLLVIMDDFYDVCSYDSNALSMVENLLLISKKANIHFIIATDTPVKDIITEKIKGNIEGILYLTLAPGEEKDFFFKKELTEEELSFLTEIGNLIYQEKDTKEKIKVPEVTETEIKNIKDWFSLYR